MPDHAGLVREITGGSRQNARDLAEYLAFYADILRASADGETIEDLIGRTDREVLQHLIENRERALRRQRKNNHD
jgi:hypothetical protein